MFVSSTFTDLKEERQAAVEAILKAGHIPAGMELFTAGDQSQMAVIKEWIDESDVYLLLLGARYGSIEATTGKSYTHLEYEYALEKGKALFAVVMTEERKEEKIRREGSKVIEQDNVQKYRDFKALVESNLVEYWNDFKDIKYAVQSTLLNFDKRSELIGWIPGSEATNSGAIAGELARLVKENADLRSQISNTKPSNSVGFNGLDFEQAYSYLDDQTIDTSNYRDDYKEIFNLLSRDLGYNHNPSALHFFWIWNKYSYRIECNTEYINSETMYPYRYIDATSVLEELRLISDLYTGTGKLFSINDSGIGFMLRVKLRYSNSDVDKLISEIRQKNYGEMFFNPIG